MSTTNEHVAMWFGACCGVLVSLLFVIVVGSVTDPKIQQCELELPRNQKCILIAVPEVTEDN